MVPCALAFYLLAPRAQIEAGVFAARMEKSSIESKVKTRVTAYEGSKNEWYRDWFVPTLQRIDVQQISWETVMALIQAQDPVSAEEISGFYRKCLQFNRPGSKKT